MKKLITILCLLLFLSPSLFSVDLEWRFDDARYEAGTNTFEFDVQIKSSDATNFTAATLAFTFNPEAFGVDPDVEITKGNTFSGLTNIGPILGSGEITYSILELAFPPVGIPISEDQFKTFCSVKIVVDDKCSAAGIDFIEGDMNGEAGYIVDGEIVVYNCVYSEDDLLGPFYLPTTTTWTGAEDSDWDNPNNWDDCVPGVSSTAIIPDVTGTKAIAPIANVNIVVNDLTIQPNGSLTVPSPFTITVDNALLLQSDATGTGSLIHNNAGLSGTLQRHLEGWGDNEEELKNGRGWHLLSSPVAAEAIDGTWQDLSDNDDFLKWNEPDNVWKNRRMPDNTLNPNFDTQFDVGISGYLVAYQDDKLKEFSGEINIADVPVSGLTKTDMGNYYGQHLLGNPFGSALEWGTPDWSTSNIAGVIQIWHEANASYSIIGPGGIIPSMQGFFVYTAGGGALTIPAAARVHSDQPYYKSDDSQITLIAHDIKHAMLQESRIGFNANATEGFDLQYDAYYMAGYAPRFYSVVNNEAFALNTYPEISEGLTIPFSFIKNDGDEFAITMESTLATAEDVLLVDLKTNTTVNLTQTGEYFFTAEEGDDPARFLLKFGTVGIEDDFIQQQQMLNIFSHGNTLYLNSGESTLDADVSVYDLLGRQVYREDVLINNSASIQLSGLSGTYIVRAVANGEVVSTKVYFR